jgi:hypothetical protein
MKVIDLEQSDDMRHPSNLPWKGRNADPEIVLPILQVIGSRLPGENPFSSWKNVADRGSRVDGIG